MGKDLGIGIGVGFGLYAASMVVLMIMGIYKIVGYNPVSFMLTAIPLAVSAAVFEELLFRGVLFRIVEEWLGRWVALFVSSAVFGLVHLMNPAATMTGAIFIAVEAGILLGAAYMLTRPAVDEHGLPHCLELDPVRRFLGRRLGLRFRPRPHQAGH